MHVLKNEQSIAVEDVGIINIVDLKLLHKHTCALFATRNAWNWLKLQWPLTMLH